MRKNHFAKNSLRLAMPVWVVAMAFSFLVAGCNQPRYQPAKWRKSGASISGTSLPGTSLPGTSLPGTTLPGTSLPYRLPGSTLPGTTLPPAQY